MKHLAILLATYNGEAYLDEQLHSLLNQSYKDWSLYIHDDGSSDGTVSIIKRYADMYDNIIVLNYISGTGAKDNFLSIVYFNDKGNNIEDLSKKVQMISFFILYIIFFLF